MIEISAQKASARVVGERPLARPVVLVEAQLQAPGMLQIRDVPARTALMVPVQKGT